MPGIEFAVITVSDSCYGDAVNNRSGPRLVQLIEEYFEVSHIVTEILPDEQDLITATLKKLSHQAKVSCIITTGGTGFAPRDVTPEATKAVIDKECPQLSVALAIHSLQKTKFAALSRSVCGIAGKTLILNFPGSEKAVIECFDYVKDLLPHALHLISDELALVKKTHDQIQGRQDHPENGSHVCPHKTGAGNNNDRNSPFPMLAVSEATDTILAAIKPELGLPQLLKNFKSAVDIPPFRASIKDGYAMKSTGFSGSKKVLGYISAGDAIIETDFQEDECYKINTGAPVPLMADCVIQIEDTKLLKTKKNGLEDLVEILVEPRKDLDIRPIGSDLVKGTALFPSVDMSPVVVNSLLASVGHNICMYKPSIAVISTGSELLDTNDHPVATKIYDSNTTMLKQLLEYFGFECSVNKILNDDFNKVYETLHSIFDAVDFVICSGGVSMGDKDYIKPVLEKLNFNIKVGRVNMKPGKPMTFASKDHKYFFGLPGNPVSAFVCFHMFALPAIRFASGVHKEKCQLPVLSVMLQNASIALDSRPEYMRATITSKNGQLYASITGNQMSSRLQSIVGADVLVHLPARSENKKEAKAGDIFAASVLRYDFISKYE